MYQCHTKEPDELMHQMFPLDVFQYCSPDGPMAGDEIPSESVKPVVM
jgi:hypothetical protein